VGDELGLEVGGGGVEEGACSLRWEQWARGACVVLGLGLGLG
jgi:hypothetical protein